MPVKLFVINNGGYHSIRQTQQKYFGDRPLIGIGEDSGDIGFPDLEKLAWAYGYPYFRAEHNSQLKETIGKTLAQEGPVICEVYVTRDQFFEPKSSGKQLPDGRMVSPPLEDLEPFLSDEEMKENMYRASSEGRLTFEPNVGSTRPNTNRSDKARHDNY